MAQGTRAACDGTQQIADGFVVRFCRETSLSVPALGSRVHPVSNVGGVPPDAARSKVDWQGKVARLDAPPDRSPAADAGYFHHVLAGQQFGDGHHYLLSWRSRPGSPPDGSAVEPGADVSLGKVIDVLREHSGNELRGSVRPSRSDVGYPAAERPIEMQRQHTQEAL